jgi:hypothetical protein
MASDFKIGATSGNLTSLDELTVECPDPQPEFKKFQEMVRLGAQTLRGMGPQTIIWRFPLLEVGQVAQLETSIGTTKYIRSKDRFDVFKVYEVISNIVPAKQDGDHVDRMSGIRSGYELEFIILSEVS